MVLQRCHSSIFLNFRHNLLPDRFLPIRWLFSRGSHIFPAAASAIPGDGFVYLAYNTAGSLGLLVKINDNRVNGFLAVSGFTFGITPFIALAMVPTNFELIRMNMEKGGTRSERSAQMGEQKSKEAEDSMYSKGEADQFTDVSGPQEETPRTSSDEEDGKV